MGTAHLAPAVTRLLDMGRVDEGRRFLVDALPIASKADGGQARLIYTRGLIGPLARLDLKEALAQIPTKGDERTINDFRGLIAQAIAATHPDEAERLIGAMTWDNSETYSVKTCRRMAAVNLPRAHAGSPRGSRSTPCAATRSAGWPRRSPERTAPRRGSSGPRRSGRSARRRPAGRAASGEDGRRP